MNETTFENAKVGDVLWSAEFGEVPVIHLYSEDKIRIDAYLHVRVADDDYVQYNLNGYRYDRNLNQYNPLRTLFWDEIHIVAPPRSPRMVRKVLEGWVNVYPENDRSGNLSPKVWRSEKEANQGQSLGRIACVHIVQEYEVEE